MSTATSRNALGSLFGTVSTAANTLTSTLDAATKGIGMANAAVTSMAQKQAVRIKLDEAIFQATVHQDKAQELASSRIRMKTFMDQSKAHKDAYLEAYQELEAVLNG